MGLGIRGRTNGSTLASSALSSGRCSIGSRTGISPTLPKSSTSMDQNQMITTASCTTPLQETHRTEEHTSELQSLMRLSYAVHCLKKQINHTISRNNQYQ